MDEAEWAINEFGGALLGDSRRTDRLIAVATVLGQRPSASIPAACDDPALRKGTYRLLENGHIAPAAILASHIQATWERVADVPVVLAVQDTTELDFTGHLATRGLGPLRHGRERGNTSESLPDGMWYTAAMTKDDEIRRLRAENTALAEENATLRGLVAEVQQALAAALAQIAQLEATVAHLQAARDQATKPPPFVKTNTPSSPTKRPPRKKRAAGQNKARRRAEPTQIVYHEFERCPTCTYQLRGGHEVWRRQIIELPAPQPVAVIEHRIMTRHCPCC